MRCKISKKIYYGNGIISHVQIDRSICTHTHTYPSPKVFSHRRRWVHVLTLICFRIPTKLYLLVTQREFLTSLLGIDWRILSFLLLLFGLLPFNTILLKYFRPSLPLNKSFFQFFIFSSSWPTTFQFPIHSIVCQCVFTGLTQLLLFAGCFVVVFKGSWLIEITHFSLPDFVVFFLVLFSTNENNVFW